MNHLQEIIQSVEVFLNSCGVERNPDIYPEECKDVIELHSIIIGDRNEVWLKGYWEPYQEEDRHVLFSISKSFSCMALGLLWDDGIVDLNCPMTTYFPEYAHLADGYMREVTLHHLLCMNAGTNIFTTSRICTHGERDDWAANFFADELPHKPGAYFQYNTPASYMIGRCVKQLSGKNPLDLLNERIFWNMGIRDVQWDECPLGCNTGGWGVWMRPSDLFKIGQLFLRKGIWNSRQLLSDTWIKKMGTGVSDTSRLQNDTERGYGYQTWINASGGYSFRGMFGQYCYIIPEKDCVMVITSGTHQKERQSKCVDQLAADLKDFHDQSEALLPYEYPALSLRSLLAGEISSMQSSYREYQMEPNREGYESIGLLLGEGHGYLHLNYDISQGGFRNVLPFGYGTWGYGTRTCKGKISCWTGGTRKVATCAGTADGELCMVLQFMESSNAEYWHFLMEGENITIERNLNCGDNGDISMETLRGDSRL